MQYTIHRYFGPCWAGIHDDCTARINLYTEEEPKLKILNICSCRCHVTATKEVSEQDGEGQARTEV
jgi:hypothetical protein